MGDLEIFLCISPGALIFIESEYALQHADHLDWSLVPHRTAGIDLRDCIR